MPPAGLVAHGVGFRVVTVPLEVAGSEGRLGLGGEGAGNCGVRSGMCPVLGPRRAQGRFGRPSKSPAEPCRNAVDRQSGHGHGFCPREPVAKRDRATCRTRGASGGHGVESGWPRCNYGSGEAQGPSARKGQESGLSGFKWWTGAPIPGIPLPPEHDTATGAGCRLRHGTSDSRLGH